MIDKSDSNEQIGFPLIGDKLPQMEVKTTHGMIKLPDDFSGNGLFFLVILQTLHQFVPQNSLLLKKDVLSSKNLIVSLLAYPLIR
jgi:hypothetical protein